MRLEIKELFEILNCLSLGVILVSDQAKVIFANKSARDILSEPGGLSSQRGHLVAGNVANTASLMQFLKDTARGRKTNIPGDLHRAFPVSRENGNPLSVILAPLRYSGSGLNNSGPLTAVFVCNSERNHETPEDVLTGLFGLTHVETVLTLALLYGQGLQWAAHRTGIGINTAKSHLKRVFVKTGTRRQAELVRLIMKSSEMLRYD